MVRHFVHRIRHFLSTRKIFQKMDDESRKSEFYFLLGIIVSIAGNYIVEVFADTMRNLNQALYWSAFIISALFFALLIGWVYSDYFKQRTEKQGEIK